MDEQNRALLERCLTFLETIGLPVSLGPVPATGILPGLAIQDGRLCVDQESLAHPGDVLHEAAHIAVAPATERATLNDLSAATRPDLAAEELMAICWSYAACVHLGLEPATVFHDAGYRGGSSGLVEAFTSGAYVGLPMLQWVGMALDEANAEARGLPAYPHMLTWLRDGEA